MMRLDSQQLLPSRTTSGKSSRHLPTSLGTLTWIIFLLTSCCISFYAGIWTGWSMQRDGDRNANTAPPPINPPDCTDICINALVGGKADWGQKLDKLHDKLDSFLQQNSEKPSDTKPDWGQKIDKLNDKLDSFLQQNSEKQLEAKNPSNNNEDNGASNPSSTKRFPESVSHFAKGLIRVNRQDLFDRYDFGVPINPAADKQDILMLYDSERSMPSNDKQIAHAAEYGGEIPKLDAESATSNCDMMNVMFLKRPDGNPRTCTAIVGGQYQSSHIQKWMRLVGEGIHGEVSKDAPLRLTGRMTKSSGYDELLFPKPNHIDLHQETMLSYLTNIKQIRSELTLILEKIAIDNTIIVSTVNQGQSELLENFVCSSRSKGFELGNLLVFPTDKFSKDIAEGMGVATYYSEELMGSIPEKEAARYGDSTFGLIMMAKVICVQLVVELGYDVLFQDVDIIWYKDPLAFFHHDEKSAMASFDVYFQFDGNRQERYAPYSANSGFYYIRNNDRSKLFFKTMLYSGDLIFACRSHQQILIALLAEANSLTGLKVKILDKNEYGFPGGQQYHSNFPYMKEFIEGKVTPQIFHMSWTLNKDDKLKFLRQMGMWYVNDHCIGKEANEITDGKNPGADMLSACCSAEPLFSCHYSDKPSIKSCADSPPKDKNGLSFWR